MEIYSCKLQLFTQNKIGTICFCAYKQIICVRRVLIPGNTPFSFSQSAGGVNGLYWLLVTVNIGFLLD